MEVQEEDMEVKEEFVKDKCSKKGVPLCSPIFSSYTSIKFEILILPF